MNTTDELYPFAKYMNQWLPEGEQLSEGVLKNIVSDYCAALSGEGEAAVWCEIDFGGKVKARMRIKENKITRVDAIDRYGDSINPDKIFVIRQDHTAPSGEGEKMAEGWEAFKSKWFPHISQYSKHDLLNVIYHSYISPLRSQLEAGKAPESAWDWNGLLQEFLNFSLDGYKTNHDIFNWFKAKIQSNK